MHRQSVNRLSLMLALAFALPSVAVSAQVDPHQPANDGSAAASQTVTPGAVAPGLDPGTRAANGAVAEQHATAMAAHDSDIAAYDAAVRAHGREVMRQDARYARQQAAYADAMAAWRAQAAACSRGRRVACNAPAPDPANYY